VREECVKVQSVSEFGASASDGESISIVIMSFPSQVFSSSEPSSETFSSIPTLIVRRLLEGRTFRSDDSTVLGVFRVICMHLVKYKAREAPAPTYTHALRLLEEGIEG
jgi:hypothetical protein